MAKREKKDVTVAQMIKSHGFEDLDDAFVYVCEQYATEVPKLHISQFAKECCFIAMNNEELLLTEICSGDPNCEDLSVVGYSFSEKTKDSLSWPSTATSLLCAFFSEKESRAKMVSDSLKSYFVQDFLFTQDCKSYYAAVECSGICFALHEFAIYNEIKEEFQAAFIAEICEHYEL
jgi:hypothetical protein